MLDAAVLLATLDAGIGWGELGVRGRRLNLLEACQHQRINAALIEKFLAIEISWHPLGEHLWTIMVAR